MDQATKQYLNSLRCPVCEGQIDIIDSKLKLRSYNYACVNNNDHYVITVDLKRTVTHIHDESHRFEIIKQPSNSSTVQTILSIFAIDAEGRVVHPEKSTSLTFDGDVIPFNGQGLKKIINRLKTIMVFQ